MRKAISSVLLTTTLTLVGCAPTGPAASGLSTYSSVEKETMGEIDFYDERGRPVAYTDDGIDIFTFTGRPVAYFDGGSVYSFSGRHLGWFEDGWIRDNDGRCVFYTPDAQGGPVKPVQQVKPVKSIKSVRPIKAIRSICPIKAVKSFSWSRLSGEQFFAE
jgi:hypothetical protein